MIAQQVSLGHTWCLILSLVSVWSSPLYNMSVCLLLTSATVVFMISCWFLIVQPGPQSRALCGAVCIINSYCALLNWLIVSLLILFILFSMFFVLIHNYTLCFTGSPCCNFSHYNYIAIWSYYIVIHITKLWEELLWQQEKVDRSV